MSHIAELMDALVPYSDFPSQITKEHRLGPNI